MTDLPAPLRLHTFGSLSLRSTEAELAGAALQPRRLAVLAVIAAGGGRGVTRAKVLGLLWPEVDEPRGRQALSQALYALRRACGTPPLTLGSELVRLNPDVITSDLDEMDRAIAARQSERVALLHTGAFCDGIYLADAPAFERWVEEQRAHYATRAGRALEELAADADTRGDHEAAAGWWRRLTALDPLRTHAALGLMHALAAAGRRGEAARHGEQYARLVRVELEAEPNAALEALSATLRAPHAATENRAIADRYVLERELGRGGMAVVHLAHDVRHDRRVALKMLHPGLSMAQGDDALAHEIRVTAALRHPHILPLFDSGISDGCLFFVMPYVEGESVRSHLARGSTFPTAEAVRLAVEVAEALRHAHLRGVVHRDVKPENILLSEGHAVVMDFGIAHAQAAGTPHRDAMVAGTPAYMSPEQIAGGGVADPRSDIFSLACVLFEMLSGRPPFLATATREPTDLRVLRPDAGERLATEIHRALAVNPTDRHASAEAFAHAITSAVAPTDTQSVGAAQLPSAPEPLIGRTSELDAACALILRPEVRLLTLTGAGGSGKTAIALKLAAAVRDSFDDGVCFVDLASVTDSQRVLPAIALALGARETEGRFAFDSVVARLHGHQVLLLLDNVEQVAGAAADLQRLLDACPRLNIVVTSRVRLRVRGENEFYVAPLALPSLESTTSLETLRQSPSVDLFLRRALDARPAFVADEGDVRAVAELCLRLDGLPLAIELAAARCRLLSPPALLARIDRRFDLLTGGGVDLPSRQQTLAATMEWSYDLLTPAQRTAFRSLAIYAGGSTLEAAAAVLNVSDFEMLEVAEVLMDASLLRRGQDTDGSTRLLCLESVRAYACDRLIEAGEESSVRARHFDHFAARAERFGALLMGEHQAAALHALDNDRDNYDVALDHAAQTGRGLPRLVRALWRAWLVRGQWTEGREWITRALSVQEPVAPALRAELAAAAATLSHNLGDYHAAYQFAEQSRTLSREGHDQLGEARALATMGWLGWRLCRLDEARRLSAESLVLYRAENDESGAAQAMANLGWIALFQGDASVARSYLEESLAIRRRLAEQRNVAFTSTTLAWALTRVGEIAHARALLAESRAVFEAIGERQLLAFNVRVSATIALGEGRADEAVAEMQTASVPVFRAIGDRWGLCDSLGVLGDALRAAGRVDDAEIAHDESLAIAIAMGDPLWTATGLARRAIAAESRRDFAAALEFADQANAILATAGVPIPAENRAAFEKVRRRALIPR